MAAIAVGCTPEARRRAPDARFAVAANFAAVAAQLAERYRADGGPVIALSTASSGQLYSQIVQGAPFDGFLSADSLRPRRLEEAGLGLPGTRFTYAWGQLVLWAAQGVPLPSQLAHVDSESPFPSPAERSALARQLLRVLGANGRLAVADSTLAPYGKATEQALRRLGLWEPLRDKLLVAQSVLQVHRFVASGNAPLGFVARSQVRSDMALDRARGWPVPEALFEPLAQQALQLREGSAARGFLAFLRSPGAAALVRSAGYLSLPGQAAHR